MTENLPATQGLSHLEGKSFKEVLVWLERALRGRELLPEVFPEESPEDPILRSERSLSTIARQDLREACKTLVSRFTDNPADDDEYVAALLRLGKGFNIGSLTDRLHILAQNRSQFGKLPEAQQKIVLSALLDLHAPVPAKFWLEMAATYPGPLGIISFSGLLNMDLGAAFSVLANLPDDEILADSLYVALDEFGHNLNPLQRKTVEGIVRQAVPGCVPGIGMALNDWLDEQAAAMTLKTTKKKKPEKKTEAEGNAAIPLIPSPPPVAKDSGEFWEKVCSLLRIRIGREYDRWFRPLKCELYDDGSVLLTTSNPINQLWIESNYASVLADTITEVAGSPRNIRFTVLGDAAPPLYIGDTEPMLSLAYRQISTQPAERQPQGIPEISRTPETLSDAGLSPKFSFDNFVVGTTNSYCAAVAKAVAEKPGRIYNPLFFHSAPGLGKTHLLHAIGREIMFHKKRAVVRYATSESFTNEFIDAIRKQTLPVFRAKYRKVDVLLLDDIQFFAGKDSTEEEFFHTFNELFNNTKQIVLACDKAPSDTPDLEARLVSRFEWGLTTQIQMPDYETRMAILQRKLADLGGSMDQWILEFIAQRVRTDVRKLEGSLMRVAAHFSIAEGVQPSEAVIEALLRDVLDQEPGRSVNIDRILRTVAERYDVRLSELVGHGRPKMIAEARQVAMYFTREMAKLPLLEVGMAFGGRAHNTVMHACKVINARIDQDEDFRTMIADLKAKISAP